MKILQFIEIGTHATPEDFENQVGDLYQIPVDAKTTPREIFKVLADELKDDTEAMGAFDRFMEEQDEESLDKNIFDDCEISLEDDDKNQYYMIFHVMTVINIIANKEEDTEK